MSIMCHIYLVIFVSTDIYGRLSCLTRYSAFFANFRQDMMLGVSPATPPYIDEGINSGSYPHEDVFTHVIVQYGYLKPRYIKFHYACEYDTGLNMKNIRLHKKDIFKRNFYRRDQDNTAWTTYLCLLTNRTIFPRTQESHPCTTFEAWRQGTCYEGHKSLSSYTWSRKPWKSCYSCSLRILWYIRPIPASSPIGPSILLLRYFRTSKLSLTSPTRTSFDSINTHASMVHRRLR